MNVVGAAEWAALVEEAAPAEEVTPAEMAPVEVAPAEVAPAEVAKKVGKRGNWGNYRGHIS